MKKTSVLAVTAALIAAAFIWGCDVVVDKAGDALADKLKDSSRERPVDNGDIGNSDFTVSEEPQKMLESGISEAGKRCMGHDYRVPAGWTAFLTFSEKLPYGKDAPVMRIANQDEFPDDVNIAIKSQNFETFPHPIWEVDLSRYVDENGNGRPMLPTNNGIRVVWDNFGYGVLVVYGKSGADAHEAGKLSRKKVSQSIGSIQVYDPEDTYTPYETVKIDPLQKTGSTSILDLELEITFPKKNKSYQPFRVNLTDDDGYYFSVYVSRPRRDGPFSVRGPDDNISCFQ